MTSPPTKKKRVGVKKREGRAALKVEGMDHK